MYITPIPIVDLQIDVVLIGYAAYHNESYRRRSRMVGVNCELCWKPMLILLEKHKEESEAMCFCNGCYEIYEMYWENSAWYSVDTKQSLPLQNKPYKTNFISNTLDITKVYLEYR